MPEAKPWHGVNVATTLPFHSDLSVDYDSYAEHVRFLAKGGATGIIPNGSLGEYQTLTEEERKQVFVTAVEAAPAGVAVIPGVGAYGAMESVRLAEHAAEHGAPALMLLPPNAYRASDEEVVEHYRAVAKIGLPILAYNNPTDTRIDLRPDLLKILFSEGLIASVKDFSGIPSRAYQTHEAVPGLDVSVGADDVVLELGIAGAKGWVAGYTNAIPQSTVELYQLATSGDPVKWKRASEIYTDLHPLLRWDSTKWFVQAIKLSQEIAGAAPWGTTVRPPRLGLPQDLYDTVVKDTETVLAKGYR